MAFKIILSLIAFVAGSFFASFILYTLLPIHLLYITVGSVLTATIELFSKDLDDNFTVGILSGGFLYILKLVFKI